MAFPMVAMEAVSLLRIADRLAYLCHMVDPQRTPRDCAAGGRSSSPRNLPSIRTPALGRSCRRRWQRGGLRRWSPVGTGVLWTLTNILGAGLQAEDEQTNIKQCDEKQRGFVPIACL